MSTLLELREQPHWSYSALNTYLNMPLSRKNILCNIDIADGDAYLDYIQIPDGSMNITTQFAYSGLDADVTVTLQQSLDCKNFDDVATILLDKDNTSSTVNVLDVLTIWIRDRIVVGEAHTGNISECNLIFN